MKKTDDILEACRLLEELDVCPELERVPAAEAYGRVLAEKIMAGIDVPHFRRSAFDGYALRSADIKHASPENPVILRVTETIPAGSRGRYLITEGTAARIMTGAMVPKGADTVVKHEERGDLPVSDASRKYRGRRKSGSGAVGQSRRCCCGAFAHWPAVSEKIMRQDGHWI